MIYRSMFPGDLFAQLDRIQRSLHQSMDTEPSIRGFGAGGFPALTVRIPKSQDAMPRKIPVSAG